MLVKCVTMIQLHLHGKECPKLFLKDFSTCTIILSIQLGGSLAQVTRSVAELQENVTFL